MIERDAIRQLLANEIVQVRAQLGNGLIAWGVNVDQMDWYAGSDNYRFLLSGRIIAAHKQPAGDVLDDAIKAIRRSRGISN